MDKMKIPKNKLVQFNLTGSAELLQPTMFKEGDSYCCILGADPQQGVMGCGDTPEEALNEWDANLQKHLKSAPKDDQIVRYVKDLIAAKPKDIVTQEPEVIPPHVQEFYDQFYSSRNKASKKNK